MAFVGAASVLFAAADALVFLTDFPWSWGWFW
jgi:hypothetical protein